MEKRLLLAIGLSLLILLSWSAYASKTQPIVNKDVTIKEAVITATQPTQPVLKTTELNALAGNLIQYSQENFELSFIENLAALKEVSFKKYKNSKLPLKYGFLLNDKSFNFKKISQTPDSLTFEYSDTDKVITKK